MDETLQTWKRAVGASTALTGHFKASRRKPLRGNSSAIVRKMLGLALQRFATVGTGITKYHPFFREGYFVRGAAMDLVRKRYVFYAWFGGRVHY
jgi:hypothetical protein